ncbi:NADH:ubiquinone oxidoreductase 6.6kD subunit [Xylaria sp. CBS 124048]|nr:NADH:ubiquinone oxidoreductase 6.6kD subunit [Xylaria sp. CBS 124048]
MAGLEHFRVALDPAIQKLGTVSSARTRYFRWNARTARITFTYIVVVPGIIGAVAYKTDGLFDLRGKRRGDMMTEW